MMVIARTWPRWHQDDAKQIRKCNYVRMTRMMVVAGMIRMTRKTRMTKMQMPRKSKLNQYFWCKCQETQSKINRMILVKWCLTGSSLEKARMMPGWRHKNDRSWPESSPNQDDARMMTVLPGGPGWCQDDGFFKYILRLGRHFFYKCHENHSKIDICCANINKINKSNTFRAHTNKIKAKSILLVQIPRKSLQNRYF